MSRRQLWIIAAAGLATAKSFVTEGAHVCVTGRRDSELARAAAAIARNV